MAFKFFENLSFYQKPSISQIKSSYGILPFYISSDSLIENSLILNTSKINQVVDFCISNNYEALCWDETSSHLNMSRPGQSDSEIDAILNALKSIYDACKERAILQGRPDLLVGFLGIPGGFNDEYFTILQYEQSPSNPVYAQNYQLWTSWLDRLNKRKISESYVSSPFSNCCDMIVAKIFPKYGESSINDWKIFARKSLQEMRSRLSGGKETIGFISEVFSYDSPWIGQQVSSSFMEEMISTVKLYGDSIGITGGNNASYIYSNWRWRPSGTSEASDLISWQSVTNGAFSVVIANVKLKITGINTSSCTSMSQVATLLQSAIQSKITSSSNPSFDGIYPFSLGTVTVSWSSVQKSFLFNMTTNGPSTIMPPSYHRGTFSIESKDAWGSTVSGTDLASPQFIGLPTINPSATPGDKQWVYGNVRDSLEWDNYASSRGWWQSYSSQSVAEGNSYNNPVIPQVSVLSNSGDYPFTVHVDAMSSNFNGVDAEDCIYEWDFGDPSPSSSIRNYSYVTDGRLDVEQDTSGQSLRNTALNNKQRGMNAAYTYWHNNGGSPFTIKLKIWYNGVLSDEASTTVSVSSPVINDYPTVTSGQWTRVPVMPGERTPPANTFQSIYDAITTVEALKTDGKIIYDILSGTSGDFTLPVQQPITITRSNTIVRTTNALGVRLFAKNGSFSRSSPTAFFTINNNSPSSPENIHFLNIQFGYFSNVGSGLPGGADSAGQEQGSENTSNLIGCVIKNPLSGNRNITFTNCYFDNLYQAVTSENLVKGVYFNQCRVAKTKIKSCEFDGGSHIVINASVFGDAGQPGVSTDTDNVIHVGTASNRTDLFSINFSNLRFNASFGSNYDSAGKLLSTNGCINLKNARYSTTYGCVLYTGSSYITNSTISRFDSNLVFGGGNSDCLVASSPSSNFAITNNVFRPGFSGASYYSGILSFAGSSGSISKIKIINNTAISSDNVISRSGGNPAVTAYWNFKSPSGVSLTNLEFVNNLNIENRIYCISKWICIDNTQSQFAKFSNNLWPVRRSNMEFAVIGGVKKDWSYWTSWGLEKKPEQINILIQDIKILYTFKLPHSDYPFVSYKSCHHRSTSKDYNDENRFFSSRYSVGATRSNFYIESPSTASFSVNSSIKTRTRTAMSSCQNAFIAVTDTVLQTVDSSNNAVLKPVTQQSGNISDILDFSMSSWNIEGNRAFRIKFNSSVNPNYVDARFGLMRVSSVLKYRGVFTNASGVSSELISLTLSDYSTIGDLINAINALSISGLTVESFGTSDLSVGYLSEVSVLGAGLDKASTISYWHVTYLKPGSSTLGDWIHSSISVDNKTDGYDVTITLINDGPASQTYGDLRQRIGTLWFDGIFIGRKFAHTNDTVATSIIEGDTWLSNYNGSPEIYPFDKFSPCINFIGATYGVGISVLHDFSESKRTIEFVKNSQGDKAYSLNAFIRFNPLSQADTLEQSNRDCIKPGESLVLKIAFRVTRDYKNWYKTLKPYKEYFANTFGPVQYKSDPRPLYPITPASGFNGEPLNFANYQSPTNQNPARWGWAYWANRLKNLHNTYGYERQIMWCPAGFYWSGNYFNYPMRNVTPYLNTNGEFPHGNISSYYDSCSTYSSGNCVPQTLNISPLLTSTFYMLRDAIQEIPFFGIYQGYGTVAHMVWNPDGNQVIPIKDMTNSEALQALVDELDCQRYYLKTSVVGIDAYAVGFDDLGQCSDYLDFVKNKYPGFSILAEVSPEDVTCTRTATFQPMYTNSIDGPDVIADYILPGVEKVMFLYGNFIWLIHDYNSTNDAHYQNILEGCASFGFCPAPQFSENVDIKTDASKYIAADRRFVYDEKPADVASLKNPTNIKYTFFDLLVNEKYQQRNQSIKISWDANVESDFSHYVVYKAPVINGISDPTKPYQLKKYLKYPLFFDNQVFHGKTYYYKIVSYDVYNNSSESNIEITYISDDPDLKPPSSVSASSNVSLGKIRVSWNYDDNLLGGS